MAQHYRLNLPACLQDWFDHGASEADGSSEFCVPIHPADLLTPFPESIWPPLMPCDLVPLIGNQTGDFLCARVGSPHAAGSQESVSEIVHWYHGGGDRIPWGDTLPQAIVFDALVDHLPGPGHRHATPATPAEERRCDPSANRLVQWALPYLPGPIADLFDSNGLALESTSPQQVASTLLTHEVAEVAVTFELIESTLFPIAGPVDWKTAESLALSVTDRRDDLAWSWNVAALAAARRGDDGLAAQRYAKSCLCSNFSDQSVRLRHHWDHAKAAKFAADQLRSLAPEIVSKELDETQQGLLALYTLAVTDDRGQRVTDHWMAQSQRQEEQGQLRQAFDGMVQAGWDLGAAPLSAYDQVLDELVRLATANGDSARLALASIHLHCFRNRYGKP